MNPTDHPMGGGEGRSKGGRHPFSPTGVPAKGGKTRKKRKPRQRRSSAAAGRARTSTEVIESTAMGRNHADKLWATGQELIPAALDREKSNSARLLAASET